MLSFRYKFHLGLLLFTKFFSILVRISWQISIATTLCLGALIYRLYSQQFSSIHIDIRATTLTLGSIGSILALATSISFAFVVFFVNQTNSRKHDLFYKFKSSLFDFDRFLKDYPDSEDLINEAQALSWHLKFVKLDDFPLQDWDDKIMSLAQYLDEDCDYEDDPNLKNKVIGYLGYFEDIVNEIGVMCIRQVIAGIFVKTVIKAFFIIGLLLIFMMVSYLDLGLIPNLISSVMPVFFATFACLIFTELGWYLYRESNEMISFTRHDKNEIKPEIANEST